jgi:HNH endonuclease
MPARDGPAWLCRTSRCRAQAVGHVELQSAVPTAGRTKVGNGLLLRSDLHTPFDRGYLTLTHDLRSK